MKEWLYRTLLTLLLALYGFLLIFGLLEQASIRRMVYTITELEEIGLVLADTERRGLAAFLLRNCLPDAPRSLRAGIAEVADHADAGDYEGAEHALLVLGWGAQRGVVDRITKSLDRYVFSTSAVVLVLSVLGVVMVKEWVAGKDRREREYEAAGIERGLIDDIEVIEALDALSKADLDEVAESAARALAERLGVKDRFGERRPPSH